METKMSAGTMFEKIWQRHVIGEEEGELLLHVDRAERIEGFEEAYRQERPWLYV